MTVRPAAHLAVLARSLRVAYAALAFGCAADPVATGCPDGSMLSAGDGGRFCIVGTDSGNDAPLCPAGEEPIFDLDGGHRCVLEPPASCDAARALGVVSMSSPLPSLSAPSITARTSLGTVSWLRSGHLLLDGASARWAHTTDRCFGWWGIATWAFALAADGTAARTDGGFCEPNTTPAVGLQLRVRGPDTAVCWQGHHPYLDVTCGFLGEGTTSYLPVFTLERPRVAILGVRTDGWLVHDQIHPGAGARTARWLRADLSEETSVPLAPRPTPSASWIGEVGDEAWVTQGSGVPGECLEIERVRRDGVLASMWLPSPGGAATAILVGPGFDAPPGEGPTFFLVSQGETSAELFLVEVARTGRATASLLHHVEGRLGLADVERSGESLALLLDEQTDVRRTSVIIASMDGASSPPVVIAEGPGTSARSLAFDGSRVWAIVSQNEVEEEHRVELVSLDLAP